jgi:hypothetical protein
MEQFCSDYVRIDNSGIDLLRNRYAYKHIDYVDINSIEIRTGHLLRNRFIPLIVGIVFIAISVTLLSPAFVISSDLSGHSANYHSFRGVAIMFVIPLSLITIGGYFIVQSMIRSKILSINTDYGKFDIRIREFDNVDTFNNLISFLNDKVKC